MTECHHIGLATLVGGRPVGTERDMAIVFQVVIDATHAKHVLRIGRRDDGLPSFVIAFVAGGVTNQDALFYGFVGGFSHV